MNVNPLVLDGVSYDGVPLPYSATACTLWGTRIAPKAGAGLQRRCAYCAKRPEFLTMTEGAWAPSAPAHTVQVKFSCGCVMRTTVATALKVIEDVRRLAYAERRKDG